MSDTGHIAVHEFEGSLIAVIQIELSDSVIERFREDLLAEIRRRSAPSLIVDVSGLDVMDIHEFEQLRRIFRMAKIMGCRSILAGLQPGIVAALVQLDADTDGLETVLSVEHAVNLLRRSAAEAANEAVIDEGGPEPDAAVEGGDEAPTREQHG
jgi:rsbT antagonist protein RsbS